MQTTNADTQNAGPGPTANAEQDSQPWARFEATVVNMLRAPLEVTRQQVAKAAQDLTDKVEDLSNSHRNFEDEAQRRLKGLSGQLAEIQESAATTSAEAAADLAALRTAVDQLAARVDDATEGLRTRLEVVAEVLKQDVKQAATRLEAQIQQSQNELQAAHARELQGQIAGLGDPLRAIRDEVRAMEERTNTRQDGALASLREEIGQELSAASGRSSDADQALAGSLIHLRWTSYALLALLIVIAGLLVIAISH
jgi:chromosome segregation ATPase